MIYNFFLQEFGLFVCKLLSDFKSTKNRTLQLDKKKARISRHLAGPQL